MKLSKTNFLTYRDCKKNAWLKIHRPDIYFKYPLSLFEQNIIETGNEIDVLARELFPGGTLVEGRDDTERTSLLVASKAPVIYQPVFASERYITACDILAWNQGAEAYDLYEVKASTTSEEGGGRNTKDYLIDMAFQKIVLRELGIVLASTKLVRLNKEYIRLGDIDLGQLFIIEDLTEEVENTLDSIESEMNNAYQILSNNTEPKGYCDCILKGRNGHCTTAEYSNAGLPEYSVHDIARIGSSKAKLAELIDSNIFDIQDISPEFPLTDIQRRQVDTAQSGKPYIDKEGISEFMSKITYPITFLDYETYPSALPRFDNYRPYQQIPFQFSLHVVNAPDTDPKHYEFIYDGATCPDEVFILALKKYLPETGSVFVWNMKFEKGINTQLAERVSKHKEFMTSLNDRIIDLMTPFSGKSLAYDHPKFKGSASIKYVLPALVPELSYKSLEIQEGGTASDTWNRMVKGQYDDAERDKKRNALLRYCELDTYAMYAIWKHLFTLL